MFPRHLQPHLARLAKVLPVITVTGPRQSGKTTLCKMAFPQKPYVSLEDPSIRAVALRDPKGFLAAYPDGAILDEVQRAPDLLSYIQGIVDRERRDGMFVLTGSAQFQLLQTLTQSLAGRTALVNLLPLSMAEIAATPWAKESLPQTLFRGGYPRLYDKLASPREILPFYINTYLERDVRDLLRVHDLARFHLFLQLCAARSGQIVNLTSIGNDCGIDQGTVRAWLSVLETSWIIHFVRPHYRNFGKRLVKSPKMYFWDVGLMAALLEIDSPQQTLTHPLRGALFETFVMSELLKARLNEVRTPNVYFFADNVGQEVDAILEFSTGVKPVEIKSSQTLDESLFRSLRYYSKLNPAAAAEATLIYGGEDDMAFSGHRVLGFRRAAQANEPPAASP